MTATEALQYVVVPGMFPTLQAALHNEDHKVRLAAVDAVFYLGIKEAIPELIACVQDESSIVRNNVWVRLYDLTGTWLKDDIQTNEL
ncbi:MAG TPA: HEAT repeat domain-containing protein [Hymenobacter sp.]|nr:HEAT repeat domain-containing protein [Hymenobacter sp.]